MHFAARAQFLDQDRPRPPSPPTGAAFHRRDTHGRPRILGGQPLMRRRGGMGHAGSSHRRDCSKSVMMLQGIREPEGAAALPPSISKVTSVPPPGHLPPSPARLAGDPRATG